MSKTCRLLHAGLLASLCATPLSAVGQTQSLDAIRAAAESHVRAQMAGSGKVIASAGMLDSRLRLAPCSHSLQTFSASSATMQSARTTVGVRCDHGATWTIYVPVLVESEIPVLVLKRSAARGARLSADDIEVQTRRVSGFSKAYLRSAEELQKQTLKRPLAAGVVLTADAFTPDYAVKRGQQVTLLASAGGVQVRMAGRALADGREGARLKVQNLSSLAVVEGVIETDGVVRVSP
jgi:flagella basal body P-ring formation protein FlgA